MLRDIQLCFCFENEKSDWIFKNPILFSTIWKFYWSLTDYREMAVKVTVFVILFDVYLSITLKK